jgi:2',3'-cyclic-nucleotide 2'-phosphodiesterase
MKILYIGDIMGQPGIDVVGKVLPDLKREKQVDLVIAQSENVTGGKSMSPDDMKTLQKIGIDFFTGGNHTPKNKDLLPLLEDNNQPVIGPANLVGCPGRGWKYINTVQGQVLVISILGETFGNTRPEINNPLKTIDKILKENTGVKRVATIVDFHGDYSSEKRVIGYYLDGKVSAVFGDHWHVPTADAMVLPNGTAHITDTGMCGTLHSSLGVKLDIITERWRDGVVNKNELETGGPLQFNSVLIDVDTQTGLAKSIEQIQNQIN